MSIGIYGGTFDPIHLGHLILAEEAREQAQLDKVVFMPAKVSPFKQNKDIAEDKHRLEMVRRSVEDIEHFFVSDFEIKLNEVSYTINTLRAYRKVIPQNEELFFIMGTDSFLDIEKWYMSEELLNEFNFIVGGRPGYKTKDVNALIKKLSKKTKIIKLKNRLIDVSSTDIKERIGTGKNINFLVPKPVEEYINAFNVYKP